MERGSHAGSCHSSASTTGLCSSRVDPFFNQFTIHQPPRMLSAFYLTAPFLHHCMCLQCFLHDLFILLFVFRDRTSLGGQCWSLTPGSKVSLHLNLLHPMPGSLSSYFFPSEALSNTCLLNACVPPHYCSNASFLSCFQDEIHYPDQSCSFTFSFPLVSSPVGHSI